MSKLLYASAIEEAADAEPVLQQGLVAQPEQLKAEQLGPRVSEVV